MKYKITVNVPTNNLGSEELPEKMIDVMARAGAGNVENYSRVAFVAVGYETWKKNGEIEKDNSVKVEMQVDQEQLKDVIAAVKSIHPYEVPMIEVIPLQDSY
jgi:hypothetical protein